MRNTYLLIGLTAAPLAIQRIVDAVPAERWDDQTDLSRFSFRESIAHLSDWEPILLERLRAAIVKPGSTINAYDESLRAVQNNYKASNPVEEAARLLDRREITVRFIREQAEGHWANTVIHPERGELSLYDLANVILGHDHYHIEHLTQYLAKSPSG
jgi:hypothetical protein